MTVVDPTVDAEAGPVRRVIRGAGAARVDDHAFDVVTDLPTISLSRPVTSGDRHLDALRTAAWEEGRVDGLADGRAVGHADGLAAGRAEGVRLGHAEGLAAGRADAAAELTERIGSALHALDLAATDLRQRDAVTLADVESGVVELAVRLAEAILEREVASVDGLVLDAVRRSLGLAPDRGELVVRVSPADLAVVVDAAPLAPGREVEVVADPAVGRGGCLIDCGPARIDARIETGLDRARAVLLGTDESAGDLA